MPLIAYCLLLLLPIAYCLLPIAYLFFSSVFTFASYAAAEQLCKLKISLRYARRGARWDMAIGHELRGTGGGRVLHRGLSWLCAVRVTRPLPSPPCINADPGCAPVTSTTRQSS